MNGTQTAGSPAGTGTGARMAAPAAAPLARFEALLRRQHDLARTRRRSLGSRVVTGSAWGVATPDGTGATDVETAAGDRSGLGR